MILSVWKFSKGRKGRFLGRNSTAGTINLITKRPTFDGTHGYVDLDVGNYALVRLKTAFEVNVSDRFAIRFAGVKLDRDGYIDNLADGQVPNVDDDLDGRDVWSYRITPEWHLTDRTTLWGVYERLREADDRVRAENLICVTSVTPVRGCEPDEFGLEPPNQGSSVGGFLAALGGMIPPGAGDAEDGLNFDFPRPELGLRDQHTDFEPVFKIETEFAMLGLEHEFDAAHLSILASYRDRKWLSEQDRFMDVGFTLEPTFYNPSGLWPTSRTPPPGKPFGGPCPVLEGLAGSIGGCIADVDQTRYFSYDHQDSQESRWTIEAKLASSSEGQLDWIIGAQYQEGEVDEALYMPNNVLGFTGAFRHPPHQRGSDLRAAPRWRHEHD